MPANPNYTQITPAAARKIAQAVSRFAATPTQNVAPVNPVRSWSNSLPAATGQYRVLMIIDNLNPGTWGVDYPRFHT